MTESVVVVTGSSELCGWPVLEPHPDSRIRAEMRNNVCFMGAKVARIQEKLLSSVVKDTEMTEKKKPYHPGNGWYGNEHYRLRFEWQSIEWPIMLVVTILKVDRP